MPSVLFAIVSSLVYGIADFAGGFASRKAHVLRIVAISAPASLVLEIVVLPFLGASWAPPTLAWGALSGLASAFAFALLYMTLALGPMTVLAPITAIVSALLPLVVGLAQGEPFSLRLFIGVAVAIVAILLVAGSGGSDAQPVTVKGLLLACGAGAAIALQLIALDQAPADSGVAPLVIGRTVSSVLLVSVLLIRLRSLPPERPMVVPAVLAGVLDSLANLLFLLGTRAGDLGVTAVIVSQYPASTVLLAWIILREKVARLQWLGLACASIALSLLATS